MAEYELSQTFTAANAPEFVALRDADNEVPAGVAGYSITRIAVTDQSAAQNDVSVQNYDPVDANVDSEVVTSVAADETETPGANTNGALLTVPRGSKIRVNVEGDADVTLYIEPDNL